MSEDTAEAKNVISIAIKDKSVLYAAYMPFVKEGGLFIPTKKPFSIGQKLSLMITLLEDPEKFPIEAEVVWCTPSGAQANRAAGIGLQFTGGESSALKRKIEGLLVTSLQSDKPTHTL
ncbi:MAG: pilus assembly protein PilZ [Francisellaceae bacterium]|jgi:type IV pilus assembly protein PilZ|nr:pilus assembly protein PilZ [Francisellaceae bacterium]MBT6538162.1 pilus assembly protein PilZ [Francisellaceae bacterium]